MRNYTVDVAAIDDYIRYLKGFRRTAESAQRDMTKRLDKAHAAWDDRNYELTQEAMADIDAQLDKLFASLDMSIASLTALKQGYSDYLNRRRR